MDRYNCISITNNLDELDIDMNNWILLPYDLRKRANEISLSKYGCTNEQLYNIIKAKLLSYESVDQSELESTIYKNKRILSEAHNINISEDEFPDGFTNDGSINYKLDKIQMANNIMRSDDDITIINDFIDDKNPDYDLNKLEDLYSKYSQSNIEHRHRSDHYSAMIWGYSVTDMYSHIKQKLEAEEYHKEIPISQNITTTDIDLENYKNSVENIEDELELKLKQIDSLANGSNRSLEESVFLEAFSRKISIKGKTYRQGMPEVTPFLTYDEYVNNPRCLDMKQICRVDPFTYVLNYTDSANKPYKDIREAYYNNDHQKLLEMGWNPIVEPTPENFRLARERQINWFDEFFKVDIIDLSKYSTKLSINQLNEAYELIDESKKLEPIYIVGIKENSIENQLLNINKCSEFGISFNSSLIDVFHKNNTFDKMEKEDVKQFANQKPISLFVLFTSPEKKRELKSRLEDKFNSNSILNRIDFKNDKNNFNLDFQLSKYICDTLNDCGYNYFGGIRNNIVSQHYNSHPTKFIKLFDGNSDNYKVDEIDLVTKALQRNLGYNKVHDVDVEEVPEIVHQRLIENYDIKCDKAEINLIIKNIKNDIKPEDMFDSLPKSKSFDDIVNMYNLDHRILASTDPGNIDGIKGAIEDLYDVKGSLIFKTKFIDESEIQKYNDLINLIEQDIFMYQKLIK